MIPENYWMYLQILFFVFITPGSPRVMMCSYTLSYGLNKSVWTALGDISANSLQLVFIVIGFGLLVKNNPIILTTLKWIGIAYLLYLAYDLYKSKAKEINTSGAHKNNILSFFKDGFLVAGTSPKAWLFFPLIFPQFIDFTSNYIVQFFILIITYVVLDFVSLIGYAVLAKKLIIWLKANPKVINTISACVLLIIAIIIAFTQQF